MKLIYILNPWLGCMSDAPQTPIGINHTTVVPSNFDLDESDSETAETDEPTSR